MHTVSSEKRILLAAEGADRKDLHGLAAGLAGRRGCSLEEYAPSNGEQAGAEERAGLQLVLAPWQDARQLSKLAREVLAMDAPAMFIRAGRLNACERLLVPSAGGHHTLQQLRVAGDIASILGVPMQLLRVVAPETLRGEEEITDAMAARMIGVRAMLEVRYAADALSGILSAVRDRDFIVLGAPHYWRLDACFRDTIPDLVARNTSNPVAMLVARKPRALDLRDVLWEERILLHVRAETKEEVIGRLLDTLIAERQLPSHMRRELLDKAVKREKELPTGIGCETALPHAALNGFSGVMCGLAVCPEGLRFGGEEDPVRFVLLLVSGDRNYDDYLHVMAAFARRIILPETRQRLLQAHDGAEALNILCPPLSPASA